MSSNTSGINPVLLQEQQQQQALQTQREEDAKQLAALEEADDTQIQAQILSNASGQQQYVYYNDAVVAPPVPAPEQSPQSARRALRSSNQVI